MALNLRRRPSPFRRAGFRLAACALLVGGLSSAPGLFAANQINVTNGFAVASADSAANGITPAFTTVSTITLAENANNIFNNNGNYSGNNTVFYALIFTAPSGWTFATNAPLPTVTKNTGGSDITNNPVVSVVNSTTLSVTFIVNNKNNLDTLYLNGVRVQPVAAFGAGQGTSYITVACTNSQNNNITFSTTNAAALVETGGAASQLGFSVQPSDSFQSQVINPAVVVGVTDQYGNPTTNNATVVLAIGNNAGGGTLNGTLTNATVGGLATFTNLSINAVGDGYTLTASATGLTGATSTTFSVFAASPDLPGPPTNIMTIAAGSYVIPMDNTNQSLDGTPFNIRAYGLVNTFLQNKIPVKWAIRAGKTKDAADFIASASRIWPSTTTASNIFFAGGPFIVDAAYTNQAWRVITNFATLVTSAGANFGAQVAVFRLATNTPVDIRYTIGFAPFLAVNTANSSIHTGLFDYCGITNYSIIADVGLLYQSCFTCYYEPHNADTSGVPAVLRYVQSGGNFLAECHSVDTYENYNPTTGEFQCSTNIYINNANNTVSPFNPDLAYMQFVGAFALQGGSVTSWTLNGGSFINHGYAAIDQTTNSYVQPGDTFSATGAKVIAGVGGNVFYLGGHSYGAGGNTLGSINGQRMVLNTAFIPNARPTCGFDFNADAGLGKTGATNVYATSNLVYTISVTNYGPAIASNAVVSDVLPTNGVFVSASSGGTTNAGVVTWSLGALPIGAVTNLNVIIQAPSDIAVLTNVASVISSTVDFNTNNNVSAPVLTTVVPVALLAIGKSASNTVFAASNLTYTISVTNFGPSLASSVLVTDTLPAGVTFAGASGSGTNNAGVVTWNLGALASGQISNVTVSVTAPASGTLTNIASVGSPTYDPVPTNNVTPPVVTTVTPLADVSALKTGPAGVLFGINFNYSITVSNAGPSTAAALAVTDNLPAGLIFVSAVPAASTNSSQVIWTNLGNLAANTATNLTLTVISTARGIVTNTAIGGSPTSDPNPTNNISPPVVTAITNNPPIANPDSYAITENTTNKTFAPLVNDVVQTPGGILSIIGVSATNGTATVSGTNVLFTPATNFVGTATIAYTITDNVGGTNTGLITVTVTNVPPIANPDNYSMSENTTNTFGPLGNDAVQTPGGYLTIISVSPTNGTATILNLTNVVFKPATNFIGMATIGYTIIDNVGGTNTGLISINVTNVPPAANPDSYTVSAGSTNTFSPLVNDVLYTPGGTLAIVGVTTTNGMATVSGTNVIFTPANNFTGTVTMTYTITDNVGGTNSSTITVTVDPSADVAIGKSAAASVYATSNVSYTISVTNLGPSSASSVTVTDALPAGATFASASGSYTTNNGVVSWSLGALTNNQITNLNLTVKAPVGGMLTNVATVTTPTSDPNPTNNMTLAVTTSVTPVADLGVTDAGPGNVLAGTLYTNLISVTNYGPSTASNVVVVVVQPDGSGVTNTLASLGANAGTNYQVTYVAPGSGPLTNTASVGAGTLDVNLGNNTNGAVTGVTPVAGLVVGKRANAAGVLAAGSVVYTVTVTNLGPSSAGGVTVTDALPAGVSFVSATGGGTASGNVVSWNVGVLNAGQGTSFNVTGSAPSNAPAAGSVTNVAVVWLGTNGVPSGPVVVGVTNVADLGVTDAGPGNVLAGTLYTNLISVTNYGPSTASNVVVVVVQPDGSGVTNTLASLGANAGTNYQVTYVAPGSGPLTNTASVGAGTLDVNLGNNTNGAVTGVTPVAGLVVGKRANAAGVLAAGSVVYTVTVTNLGPSSAGGVTVTDALPAGVSFVSATGGGTASGNVVSWNVGVLNAGQGTSFNVTGSAPSNAPAAGSVTNVAVVWLGTNGVPSGPVVVGVTNVADLGVTDAGPGNVLAGTLYTNLISVTNYGPSTASNVVVVVVQPDGSGVTNTLASLGANAGTNYQVTYVAPGSGPLTNTASVGAGTLDVNLGNNTNGAVTGVTPVAGLVVGKRANAAGVLAAGSVVYTVTVTNLGPSSAGGVTVTDALPAGVSFVSATGGGTASGNVVSWNVGVLNAGQGTSFNVTGSAPSNAPAAGSVTNVAVVWLGTNGVPSGPVVVGVTNVADLGVTDAGPGNVLAGTLYTNLISVTNYGPSTASNVVVVVVQPDGSGVTNTLASLGANAGTNYQVTYVAPGSGPLTNTASVGAGTLDVNLGNNTNGAVTGVTPVAGLVVGKRANAAGVLAAGSVVYTVTVTNLGPSSAGGVTVTDALPAGVSFVSATGGGTASGNVVSWNVGVLNAGQGTSFNVTGSAPSNAPAAGSVTNVAVVWLGTNGVPSGPVVVGVTNVADLGVTDAGPGNVLAGTLYTNLISVTNYGPSTASNVVVVVVQPDGSGVTNTLASLGANAGTNYQVTYVAPGSGPLTNTASVGAGTLDVNLGNNTNGAVTGVTPVAGLVVGKRANAAGVLAAGSVVYTVTVTNLGPSSAGGVTVTDALPAGVSFVSATGGGTASGNVVSWNVGVLNAGQGTSFNVTGSAPSNAPAAGSVTNVAVVWLGTNGVPSGPVVVGVTNVADLGVTDAGPGNVLAGTLYTNLISVTNYGPSTASNVVVVVVQPDGSGVTNTLASLGANAGTNYQVTYVAPGSGPLTNTASVGAGTLDVNLGNNTNGAVTGVTPVAGLVVGKRANAAGVLAAGSVVYTVTVTNLGPSSAGGVTVTDALPAGVSFVSATGGGTASGNVVSWNVGVLNAGQGTSFNVTGSAPSNAPAAGSVTNVAVVWLGTNGVPSGPVVVGVTNVADLGVTDAGPGNVLAGTLYTNLISVTNYGPSTASNVVVVVVQPDGSGVTNTLASLGANAGTNYQVTYVAPGSGPLTNTASVGAGTLDVNLGNNTNGAVTGVTPVADVAIGKSGPAGIVFGTNFNYMISVTNFGPSTAGGISVTDVLPAGLVFVSATAGWTTNGSQVIWTNLGNLISGATTALTLTVNSTARGMVTNFATAHSPVLDPNPTNNTSPPVVTTITNIPPLANPDNYVMAENSTSTFSVTTNDLVRTPGGYLTITNVGPTNGTAAILNGTNVMFTPSLNFVGTATIGYTVTDNVGGTSTSLITVTVTNAGSMADVAVFMTGPTNAYQGSNIVYQLTVTNLGPAVSSNIVVSDSLPSGLTYVGATGGGLVSNSVVTWPQITSLAAGGSTNYFITNNAASSGLFTNIASAFSLKTYDPNPTNNNGASPASQVLTLVALPQFTNSASTNVLNRQDGLYEELLVVTNTGAVSVAGIRVLVYGLPGGATPVTLWNATGTNSGGVPYVEYDAAVASGAAVSFALEFSNPYRVVFNPTNYVVQFLTVLPPPAVVPTNGFISGINIYTDTRTNIFGETTRFLLGFPTVIGKTYTIIYSDTLVPAHWTAAVPPFTATANTTFWYDDGPPKTVSRPQTNFSRFYRVIQQ